MFVTFVVPACNEERFLKLCLDSLHAQANTMSGSISIRVRVVDNDSMDHSVEIAKKCNAEVLSVPPGNAGRARNAGADKIESDYIAFVDADCVLPRGWLESCLQHFKEDHVVAVGSIQSQAPASAPWVERTWLELVLPHDPPDWETVPWLPAFNLIVRRNTFEAVGGFDESLDTCEDSDLSFRFAEHGELRRENRMPVVHLGESKSLSEFVRREMWRSRGNLRSAVKRGAVIQELASLSIPLLYVSICLLTPVAMVGACALGGAWRMLFAATFLLSVLVPTAISIRKNGLYSILAVSFLMAVYLVARGIGMLMPMPRVKRANSEKGTT